MAGGIGDKTDNDAERTGDAQKGSLAGWYLLGIWILSLELLGISVGFLLHDGLLCCLTVDIVAGVAVITMSPEKEKGNNP